MEIKLFQKKIHSRTVTICQNCSFLIFVSKYNNFFSVSKKRMHVSAIKPNGSKSPLWHIQQQQKMQKTKLSVVTSCCTIYTNKVCVCVLVLSRVCMPSIAYSWALGCHQHPVNTAGISIPPHLTPMNAG